MTAIILPTSCDGERTHQFDGSLCLGDLVVVLPGILGAYAPGSFYSHLGWESGRIGQLWAFVKAMLHLLKTGPFYQKCVIIGKVSQRSDFLGFCP